MNFPHTHPLLQGTSQMHMNNSYFPNYFWEKDLFLPVYHSGVFERRQLLKPMDNVLAVWIFMHISMFKINLKPELTTETILSQYGWLFFTHKHPFLFPRGRKASKARLDARYWWHSKCSPQPLPQKIWERCICIRSVLGFWWKLCSIPLPRLLATLLLSWSVC